MVAARLPLKLVPKLTTSSSFSLMPSWLRGFQGDFETVKIGAPLLATDEDFAKVAQAMVDATASFS